MKEPLRRSEPDEIPTRLAGAPDADALACLITLVVKRPIFNGDGTSVEGIRALLRRGSFLIAEDSD